MEIRTANWIYLLKNNNRITPRQITSQEQIKLETIVDRLPTLFGNADWFLGGGLVIPLTTGKFYRPHSDLDVNCNLGHIEQVVSNARNYGYELYQRRFSTKIGKKNLFSFRKIEAGEVSEKNHKRLKLLKTGSESLANEYSIDLFPYIRQGQNLNVLYFPWTVVESEYLGKPLYNSSNQKIPLLSLDSICKIKKGHHPEKWETQRDLEEINRYKKLHGSNC